jgi:hypothetical protein
MATENERENEPAPSVNLIGRSRRVRRINSGREPEQGPAAQSA